MTKRQIPNNKRITSIKFENRVLARIIHEDRNEES